METTTKGTIIDVRTPEEYEGGHVAGAINIPLQELGARVKDIKELPTPVILYCQSGNRSAMALQMLQQQGITGLVNGGGIYDMQA